MRRRLRSVAAVAAAAVIGLAAGCSGGGSDSGKPVKLKFLSLAWQKDSLAANKRLVAEWNKENPKIQVQYVQGSWDNVNDQLVTSFEGGDPPDIIHDDSSALAGFASQGYLTDLTKLLPADLKNDIPRRPGAPRRSPARAASRASTACPSCRNRR
jgi:ABC-type glycerol-3-phosphate transport system substrate-binding protein